MAGKRLGNGWDWQRVFSVGQLPPFCSFFYFGQQTPPPRLPLRRFVNTCLFADLFDLRVDDDTTEKLNEK